VESQGKAGNSVFISKKILLCINMKCRRKSMTETHTKDSSGQPDKPLTEQEKIDEALDETFPASDPPSYMSRSPKPETPKK
jgi:hypothetical protein